MKYSVYFALLINSISGYSRNQSVSEWGIAMTYNTHLLDWDIDTPDSGTAVFNGYFYIKGTNDITNEGYNETLGEEEIRVHPKWTKENSLRVCLSFFSEETLIREYIRWSLEYKAPKFFASFWPQMKELGTDAHEEDIRAFCAESRENLEELP